MMFVSNTSYGGPVLCESCVWPTALEKKEEGVYALCSKQHDIICNCGVCKEYIERNKYE